ncbi:YjiH family protein [Anoxynatronum buryatiense]|uniref:Nucleoside recognition GATE domain-containing membrane protein YjiH n=1 Tax=Anoxynatronum buryatiense TaxID=489973 RepID=A0AA45WXB5_9CLOT|nr:nucleoside recognition domain-containing protein [Anoxynatronum buryatiense]SMP63649.1 nucleoside recognition GATE domain-containing membrane protein YjiH [Anoxynatronum buryatiense]
MDTKSDDTTRQTPPKVLSLMKFILNSTIGICIYFIPFTIAGRKTILLDHLVTAITRNALTFGALVTLGMILAGSLLPFYEKSWKRDVPSVIITCLKLLGAALGVMAFFHLGPEWLLASDMLPLLFYTIATSVALIVPLGSFFLTFLTDYGLIGFLGVILQPVMRPVWKIPGSAAVNVVASVVGSFSVGIFMADQFFRDQMYTRRETAIVITGFSTVSTAFFVIVARNLDLMSIWPTFFGASIVVTCLVTAITVHLPPLKHFGEEAPPEKAEQVTKGHLFSRALHQATLEAGNNQQALKCMLKNVKEGIIMSLRFLPLILSIGTIAFYMARMTPFFDFAANVFHPLVRLLGIPDSLAVTKAIVTAGVDVTMPSLMMAGMEASLAARFTVGVFSISSVLFLAGTVPCILSTTIGITLKDLMVILALRMFFSLILLSLLIRLIF